MKVNTTKWPPTPRELAWLLLHCTYRKIARMFGIRHNKVQRLRDKYRILKLSWKARYRLLNRRDFSMWEFMGPHNNPPPFLRKSDRHKTAVLFGEKMIPMSTVRAMVHILLGRAIPSFVDAHHRCFNKECNNLGHIVLVSEQAHYAYHKGKIKELLPELVFKLERYLPEPYGPGCIVESVPESEPSEDIADEDWDEFLINCMLVKSILDEAMK